MRRAWIAIVMCLPLLSGCTQKAAQNTPIIARPAAAIATDSIDFSPFAGDISDNAPTVSRNLSKDALVALAICDCAPTLREAIASRIATANGVLPQFLMPPIRLQIQNDKSLQTLLNLPLGGLLSKLFARDSALTEKVREGLSEKLARFTPGGSRLAQRAEFSFDGFPSFLGANSERPTQFQLSNEAARWLYVFSPSGLWDNKNPAALGDHSWQTLEVLRSLVEWKYLFGLDANPSGGAFGGLTVDPKNPGSGISPFDPRSTKAPRTISGSYAVRIESESALDLALKGGESWQHTGGGVTLSEQALLWQAAATAFKRLRPENRSKISKMFGEENVALLPNNAHQLPLAFLPGMSLLLEGIFIKRDTREIFGDTKQKPATLSELLDLISALSEWTAALKRIETADLDAETTQRLAKTPASLQQAIQLAAQTIVRDLVTPASGEAAGLTLLAEKGGKPVQSAALTARTLYVLATLESSLQSPILRRNVAGIYSWYLAKFLSATTSWNLADLAWGKAAVGALNELQQELDLPEFSNASDLIDRALTSADRAL
jgi:hypothetical protein